MARLGSARSAAEMVALWKGFWRGGYDEGSSVGWEVVNPDLGLCVRDPLILLRRPA